MQVSCFVHKIQRAVTARKYWCTIYQSRVICLVTQCNSVQEDLYCQAVLSNKMQCMFAWRSVANCVLSGLFVVVGKCSFIYLQHAFADALAAGYHGCICNSWYYHVLWGRALGHRTCKTGCRRSKVGNPVKFLGKLLNLLMMFNIMYNSICTTISWTVCDILYHNLW